MRSCIKALRISLLSLVVAASVLTAPTAARAEDKPGYTMGHIWRFSFIKFRAGMRERYLENLQNNYVHELEAAKRQGTLLSYKIVQGEAATVSDWNVIIMVELKDMAALGRFDEGMKKAVAAAIGGRAEDEKGDAVRAEIRDYLGIKAAQEVIFTQ